METALELLKYALPIAVQTVIGVWWLSNLGAAVSSLVKAVESMQVDLKNMATHDFRIAQLERRIERIAEKIE